MTGQPDVDARGNRRANGYRIGYRFELYFSQKYKLSYAVLATLGTTC